MSYLSCPQCGQANPSDADSCSYCHASLAVAKRPPEVAPTGPPRPPDYFERLRPAMSSCPACKGPLEQGFITSSHWMVWTQGTGFLDGSGWRGEALNDMREALTITHLPGLRCSRCDLALVDLAQI